MGTTTELETLSPILTIKRHLNNGLSETTWLLERRLKNELDLGAFAFIFICFVFIFPRAPYSPHGTLLNLVIAAILRYHACSFIPLRLMRPRVIRLLAVFFTQVD